MNKDNLNLTLEEVEDLEVEGVDSSDYPDFCDAFFASGRHIKEDRELTELELDWLEEEYPDVLNEMAFESLLP